MMRNMLVQCYTIFLGALVLIGCASTHTVEKLSSEVNDLNIKVDEVNNNLDTLRNETEIAKNDASRANQRLDNKVSSYYK